MTEPATFPDPVDPGLFTASTRYRPAGSDQKVDMHSAQLSKSRAFEELREQLGTAVSDNASRVRLTIVHNRQSGPVPVFATVGAPHDVQAKLDAAAPSQPAGEPMRLAPWQAAAGPLTAPTVATRADTQQPAYPAQQSPDRIRTTYTERGRQR